MSVQKRIVEIPEIKEKLCNLHTRYQIKHCNSCDKDRCMSCWGFLSLVCNTCVAKGKNKTKEKLCRSCGNVVYRENYDFNSVQCIKCVKKVKKMLFEPEKEKEKEELSDSDSDYNSDDVQIKCRDCRKYSWDVCNCTQCSKLICYKCTIVVANGQIPVCQKCYNYTYMITSPKKKKRKISKVVRIDLNHKNEYKIGIKNNILTVTVFQ